jgi:phthalate 4,5-dioxygenase
MLSKEDNELLCRVGPGTPMGKLMRQYWIPAFISSELEADGWPRRVRLLGEDLIAFRDSKGQPGVVAENCPHRGSSMIFARNEGAGLRCAYHGWKFDTTGACVDMPSEGPNSSFKNKVRIKAYRSEERNGIVWVYMGARKEAPPLPDLEANLEMVKGGEPFKYVRQCNWAQALEGDIDTVHINFLHTKLTGEFGAEGSRLHQADQNPHLEIVNTPYGYFYAARRDAGDVYYWRITQFVMPWYTMVTGPGGKVWIPVDDYNTLIMEWRPARSADAPREENNFENWRQPYGYKKDDLTMPWGNWRLKADWDNEWLRDRPLEKSELYLGILSNPLQDSAVQVTMGQIYDRTQEYLGTTDKAIIAFRRSMIRAAKTFRDTGELPPTVDDATLYRVRGTACKLPKDMPWIEATAPWREAFSAGPPDEYAVDLYGRRTAEAAAAAE